MATQTSSDVENLPVDLRDHKLHRGWSFWMKDPNINSSKWDDSLINICTVGSVVEFWQALNYLQLPYKLDRNADYYFFQKDVRPVWEDSAHNNGGFWALTIRTEDNLNQYWINTLLAMVGEQFYDDNEGDLNDTITGCRIQIRSAYISKSERRDKMTLWTRNTYNESRKNAIGDTWKRVLDCQNEKINYHRNDEKSHN
ncbi:hypothetical protein GJ496_001152 [Pomphorhynchus laevis]|nr:hypothetical protein GJ496_000599 [Pomphorhynchus laevis]KAI0984402.1 hypothetical protein GJ496_001152 [Pomphorhynchus laevis]